MEIYLPSELLSEKASYEFLADILPCVRRQNDRKVVVNFQPCKQIYGNLASVLGALLDRLQSDGYEIWLKSPLNNTVKKILSRNGFFRAWDVETHKQETDNFIKYCRFRRGASDEFKRYIDQELVNKHLFPKHSERAGQTIISNIYEIYTNAITHGCSEFVHCCGECKQSNKYLEMTVVDCGETIPSLVNNYMLAKGEATLSPCETIHWALKDGNTTKTDTGGLGLALLLDFITTNNGSLQMVSGNAMLEYKEGKSKDSALEKTFPGTIVNMIFNLQDPNFYCLTSEIESLDINDLL